MEHHKNEDIASVLKLLDEHTVPAHLEQLVMASVQPTTRSTPSINSIRVPLIFGLLAGAYVLVSLALFYYFMPALEDIRMAILVAIIVYTTYQINGLTHSLVSVGQYLWAKLPFSHH